MNHQQQLHQYVEDKDSKQHQSQELQGRQGLQVDHQIQGRLGFQVGRGDLKK